MSLKLSDLENEYNSILFEMDTLICKLHSSKPLKKDEKILLVDALQIIYLMDKKDFNR